MNDFVGGTEKNARIGALAANVGLRDFVRVMRVIQGVGSRGGRRDWLLSPRGSEFAPNAAQRAIDICGHGRGSAGVTGRGRNESNHR